MTTLAYYRACWLIASAKEGSLKSAITAAALVFFCACASQKMQLPSTYAEQQAGYSYVAVEPSAVKFKCQKNGTEVPCSDFSNKELLNSLPDNSVRIATRLISASTSAGFGGIGATIGVEGNSYEVIIDFVNTQTVNVPFEGKWRVELPDNVKPAERCYPYERSILGLSPVNKYEIWSLSAKPFEVNPPANSASQISLSDFSKKQQLADPSSEKNITLRCGATPELPADQYVSIKERQGYYTTKERNVLADIKPFNVPVYIGIGFRLKAHVTVLSGTVNLSSLASITAAVKSNTATGTMSVQTLGVTGKAARSNLLFLDKIDETTIQNAIQVLASIKASIESDSQDTRLSPRIIGFHNTVAAGPQGINLIHSHLAASELKLTVDKGEQGGGHP